MDVAVALLCNHLKHVGSRQVVAGLDVGIVKVDGLQSSHRVAAVRPRAEAGQVAHEGEVGTRDGAVDLQFANIAVVAAHAVDVVVLVTSHAPVVPVHLESQLLGQGVRLVEGDYRPLVA